MNTLPILTEFVKALDAIDSRVQVLERSVDPDLVEDLRTITQESITRAQLLLKISYEDLETMATK